METEMTTDTPRTDAARTLGGVIVNDSWALLGEPRSFDSINVVPADFARELERELNESKEETEDLIFDLNASKAEVERMEKIEIERDEARKELIHNLQTTGGMPWREWSAECAKDGCDECSKAFVIEMLTDERDELEAEVERLKNGFQGSCYCCEPVGILNQKLEAEVEKLKTEYWFMEEALNKEIAALKSEIK